jgi:PAS domain S-box-containing protein
VAAAIALRTWLEPVLGKQSNAILLGAIPVGAWIGGVGPAFFCLILLHFVPGYWFQTPKGLWDPTLPSLASTIAFYALVILVGALGQMHSTMQRHARVEQLEALSRREQFHSALLSCMADGVLVTDPNGRVTLMNPTAEALTGWNMTAAKGKLWSEVFAIQREDRHNDVVNPIEQVLDAGEAVHESMPLVLTSRSGDTVPVAYSAAPVLNPVGQATGVVLVFRTELERRHTELALRTANQHKDEFLATLAHELRNPLVPISMGLELLKMCASDPQAAEQVRSMMQRQTQHLVRLIDELRDVSRITSGMLELRQSQVDLAGVIRDAVEATQPLLDEANHELTVRLPDRPLQLYADGSRLTQVLINLLNNAAKYTPRQGRIELTAAHQGGDVIVTVSDSGIGIPTEKIDCVFDMFARIDEGSECGPTGMGIGLTVVKRLVEMHGGSVEVQSQGRNLGTSFSVRLPALPEPPAVVNCPPCESH